MTSNHRSFGTSAALIFAALISLVSTDGLGTEAREEALLLTPMVEGVGDVVDFPGMIAAWNNTLFVNLRRASSSLAADSDNSQQYIVDGSNGGGLIGDRVVLGVWLHRAPRWSDLDDTEELFTMDQPLPTIHPIADLLLGFKNGFGLRLSVSAGVDSQESWDSSKDKIVSTGGSAFSGDLQLGYSLDAKNYHGDFGAGITLSTFELLSSGRTIAKGGLIPSFMIRHRSIVGQRGDHLSGIIDINLTRRAYTVESEGMAGSGDTDGYFTRWHGFLVAGPRLQIPGRLTMTLGLRLGLENLSGSVAEQKQPLLRSIEAPGAVATCEVYLADILYLRGGFDYSIYWSHVENPDDPNTPAKDPSGLREMGQSFRWALGTGIAPGNFTIDATVSHLLLFDGPDFIGGNSPGMFGMLSAAYTW